MNLSSIRWPALGGIAVGGVNAAGIIAVGGVNAIGVIAVGGVNAFGVVAIGGMSARGIFTRTWRNRLKSNPRLNEDPGKSTN